MKVSISWLKELVDLKVSIEELVRLLPLRTIGLKEVSKDYIELDMKGYNRADLLSMRGVAREVSSITDSPMRFNSADSKFTSRGLDEIPVEVENSELAPVYCLAKIEGLKVEPSSLEWVKKLTNSGIRSINNVADVTNLAMIEYGQPMHAFDEEKVKGKVRVRISRKNEKITTLDGKTKNLDEKDLLITDEAGPIGIAGVMGGKMSEVSDNTTTILLEAAIFKPVPLRQSTQRLGLHSEASKRFQYGLTKTNLLQALSAAIKMYEALGGKLTAITLTGNLRDEVKTIKLTQQKVNSLIGVDISTEQVESFLTALGFKLASHSSSPPSREAGGNVVWDVTVPYFRLDIEIEEDLIEEVARMYGYEKIPSKELEGEMPQKSDQSFPKFIYDLKKALSEAGLTEVQTYSFYSSKTINDLRLTIYDLIKVANPMSAETEYMRDNLWPNLLEVVARNVRQGYKQSLPSGEVKDIAIFEIGKVYSPQKGDLPNESYHLAIALCNETDNPIQELYQLSQSLGLHPKGVIGGLQLNPREYFHPTRYTGCIAEIHPRFVNKFGIEQRMAVLEIEIKELP